MKNILKIFAVVLPMILAVSSCKKDTSVSISVTPDSKSVVIRSGSPLTFKYAVTSGTGAATVKVEVSDNITLTNMPAADGMSGTMILVLREEGENSFAQITATNGTNTETYRIDLEMETVALDGASKVSVAAAGGEFSLGIKTNVDYEVVVEDSAKDWISVAEDTKTVVHKDVTLKAAANEDVVRHAKVTVKSKTSSLKVVFEVSQAGVLNNLVTTYGAREVFAPNLVGAGAEGTILWGDGLTLKWQANAKHTYTDNKVTHEAELHTKTDNVEYPTLMGVKKVSFLDF